MTGVMTLQEKPKRMVRFAALACGAFRAPESDSSRWRLLRNRDFDSTLQTLKLRRFRKGGRKFSNQLRLDHDLNLFA